jgi:hypothetical protein
VDDHFRAAAVPSRTQAPEAVLLWDGLPAARPLRCEMAHGPDAPGPEAIVLDANGRELRRFSLTDDSPSDDPAAMATALIDRLEQLCLTGQVPQEQRSAMGSVMVGEPVRPQVATGGAARKLGLVLLVALLSVTAGVLFVAAAGSKGSPEPEPAPQAQTDPGATELPRVEPGEAGPAVSPPQPDDPYASLRAELATLHTAQQKQRAATGAYSSDRLKLGVPAQPDVDLTIVLGGPDRYVATASRPPHGCTLTAEPDAVPRVDCVGAEP